VDEYKIVKKQITVTVPNTKPAATLENMLCPLRDKKITLTYPVKVYPYKGEKRRRFGELTGHWIMEND
jgi:hypothetical protein